MQEKLKLGLVFERCYLLPIPSTYSLSACELEGTDPGLFVLNSVQKGNCKWLKLDLVFGVVSLNETEFFLSF